MTSGLRAVTVSLVESQRESVPEPDLAVPVASPAAAGAVPAAFGGGTMTPASVLALQRSAGNSAVTRMLGRVDKTPVEGPADFGVSGGEPQSSGGVTAKPDGEGVRAESPDVKFQAKVWLQDDKTLEGSQNFGFVQNLVNSNRGTVYRRGGDPAGDITSEPHDGRGKAWDAVSDPKDDSKPNKGVFPPFYWPPGSMNDENTSGNPATTDPNAHDQPGFTMPAKDDNGGRITEFKGSDQFKLGVAVKKGDPVHMLKAFDWSVPWDVQVDKNLNGAGKAVASKEVQDLLKDGPDTGLRDWSLRPNSGDVWEGFSTQEEANKRSTSELLKWVGAAQAHDPTSHGYICAALDSRAPGIDVTVNCDTTDGNFGKDVLSASVLRDGTLIRSEGAIRLNNGESRTLSFSWSEMFGSAANIRPGCVIKVEVYVGADSYEVGHGFSAPFSGSSPQLTPGDGKYSVSVSI